MIFLYILLLLAGFLALVKGADMFVGGSSSLAHRFHVPSLVIGLTIVAIGTSAPELAVSTAAAIQGSNEIALSNVVGSNIFNILVVLGLCAILHPVPTDRKVLIRDFPISVVATIIVLIGAAARTLFSGAFLQLNMSDTVGVVSRPLALALLAGFAIYIGYLIIDARRNPVNEEAQETASLGKCALYIIIGLALIVGGGEAVVTSAKAIARMAGMSETLIGLTIVAVGTSLPELVTSVVAARKGETGLAVGNVIGSNVMNLLFVLGLSAAINPIGINLASVYDMFILIGVSLLTFIFLYTVRRIDRWEGIVMVGLYIADVVYAIMR